MMLSDVSESVKASGEATVPSVPIKPVNQTSVSSGDEKARDVSSVKSEVLSAASSGPSKSIGKAGVSAGLNIGAKYKAFVSSRDKGKAITKVLIGLEMILIDEEENVIQGFIPNGRIETYLRHMKAGGTNRLNKFFGSKSKPIYRVADQMSPLASHGTLSSIISRTVPLTSLRIGSGSMVTENSRLPLIKEVIFMVLSDGPLLDETEIAASRRVELHVQTHDDPVLKLYLWDKAAFQFCEKFKASIGTARVILVTTLNPKLFGGVLYLSSMASSRVFLDSDVQETCYYDIIISDLAFSTKLDSNLDVANMVNAEVVTKPELATLGDLFSYMNQAAAKVTWFECTATIDDVVHGSGWYYIGCGVCHTKATKRPTTFMCKKCGKSEIDGVTQRIKPYFFVLGDAGEELTGKKATKLVERYYQANEDVGEDHIVPVPQAMIDTIGQTRKFIVKANEDVGEDHIVPVPQAMIDTIGQTRKFIVKVSNHNLNGKSQTLTVTKVLPLKAPEPVVETGENVDGESDSEGGDHADESVKRSADGIELEGVKRAKCG
ncbi:PREDICTED: uncharacterized protein LOC106292221 [Brassica oleracea var. oleracea]|uniref:uncharacterized protein LOC106292221 n=1 Tax=Brassica oleracea var. oleracea TaxID=109376 RepID=UPI0006A74A05|nr:PREDICTED: uncharacterized protein LOC106292221 [Brassica oleracea var. oleracea]